MNIVRSILINLLKKMERYILDKKIICFVIWMKIKVVDVKGIVINKVNYMWNIFN